MPNPNNPHGFICEFVFASESTPLWQGQQKSNTTITDGDALFATAGFIIPFAAHRKVLGVSVMTQVTAATARSDLLFVPNLESAVFSAQYGSATSLRFTQGLIWSRRNIVGATGVQRLSNGTAPSNALAYIIGLRKTSAFGTYGEAMFIFTKSAFTNRNNQTIAGLVGAY